jgi:hypothetical protein
MNGLSFKYSVGSIHITVSRPVAARGGSGGQLPPGASGRGRQKRVVKNFFDDGTSDGGDRGVARGSDFPRPPLEGLHPQSKLNTPKQKFSYTSHWD